jgi:hypothetical protein
MSIKEAKTKLLEYKSKNLYEFQKCGIIVFDKQQLLQCLQKKKKITGSAFNKHMAKRQMCGAESQSSTISQTFLLA